MPVPEARVVRVERQRRLELKIAHEEFGARARSFSERVEAEGADGWKAIAVELGLRIAAGRELLACPEIRARLLADRPAPAPPEPKTFISISELGPADDLASRVSSPVKPPTARAEADTTEEARIAQYQNEHFGRDRYSLHGFVSGLSRGCIESPPRRRRPVWGVKRRVPAGVRL